MLAWMKNYLPSSSHWPLGPALRKLLSLPRTTPFSSFNSSQPSLPSPIAPPSDPLPPLPSSVPSDPDLDGSPIPSDHPDDIQDPDDHHPIHHHLKAEQEQVDDHDHDHDDEDDQRFQELLVDRSTYPNLPPPDRSSSSHPTSSAALHHPPASARMKFSPVPNKRPSLQPDRNPHHHHHRPPPIPTSAPLAHRLGINRHQIKKPFRSSSNSIEPTHQIRWGAKRPLQPIPPSQPLKRPRLLKPLNPSNPRSPSELSQENHPGHPPPHHHPHPSRHSQHPTWSHHPLPSAYDNSSRYEDPNPFTRPSHSNHTAAHRSSGVEEWKKRAVQVGLVKLDTLRAPGFREQAEETERRWMADFNHLERSQPGTRPTLSSFPSSPKPVGSSHQISDPSDPSDSDLDRLPELDPELKTALYRVVHSWVNRSLAEAFCRLALSLQSKSHWPANKWGSIKVEQLAQAVDRTYSRGVNFLIRSCKADQFMDLLHKPVRSGIFFTHQDPDSDEWYVKFGKDFTPIGMLYRPLIKAMRKHLSTTGYRTISANKLVRKYLISNSYDEEDLNYLFKDDKDPFECLRRAQRDGIIEIQGLRSSPSLSNSNPVRFGQKNKNPHHWINVKYHDPTSIENSYIKLNHDWLSNKETFDPPPLSPSSLLASPTTTSETCSNTNQTDHSSHLKPSAREVEEVSWKMGAHPSKCAASITVSDDGQTTGEAILRGIIREGPRGEAPNQETCGKTLFPTNTIYTTTGTCKMNGVTESHAIMPNEALENPGQQVQGASDVEPLDDRPDHGLETGMTQPSGTVGDPSLPPVGDSGDQPPVSFKRVEDLIQTLIDQGFQPPV